MPYDPHKHHRQSIRLKGYDYAQPGTYFVTLCVRKRESTLGSILDGQMQCSDFGIVASNFWAQIPAHFPHVSVDIYTVMPNHVHAILILNDIGTGVVSTPPSGGETPPLHPPSSRTGGVPPPIPPPQVSTPQVPPPPTLGQIIAYYKYQTTVQINLLRSNPGAPFWHRGFYEHIIRNDRELQAIRQYIYDNPLKWDLDQENPARIRAGTKR